MSVQVQVLKLSEEVAASWELPATTTFAEIQTLVETTLGDELGCRVKVSTADGRLLRDSEITLDSLLEESA